jgi:hypothetical protein
MLSHPSDSFERASARNLRRFGSGTARQLCQSSAMAEERNTLDDLRQLRDELRVKMHLAEMETRDWWEKTEPKLVELEEKLEQGAAKANNAVDVFVDEMARAFQRVRDRMGGNSE